jgi:demethylmenaquinone methyltransferase/2-methoxy-6-polyprenyl-1,4-benzoquinol methylase
MSPAMVREGRRRAEEMGLSGRCDFIVGNAEALPYPNCGFDAYTIGFGIRNVTHVERALNEAFRVLKPGGRFLCLEFSHPDSILLQPFYDAYSFAVIPAIGKVVTGDGRPYRYLVESIRTFPPQPQFKALIEAAGFSRVSWRNLAGGVVAIHSGWRI